jgi:hypothetical protein
MSKALFHFPHRRDVALLCESIQKKLVFLAVLQRWATKDARKSERQRQEKKDEKSEDCWSGRNREKFVVEGLSARQALWDSRILPWAQVVDHIIIHNTRGAQWASVALVTVAIAPINTADTIGIKSTSTQASFACLGQIAGIHLCRRWGDPPETGLKG